MLTIIFQNLTNANTEGLSPTVSFLTAIITPALLISASGTMVLSTSTRLGRVIDRVRQLTPQLEEMIMTKDKENIPFYEQKLEVSFKLLDMVTSRSRILQKAMVAFYRGIGCFVLTSVSIGIVGIIGNYLWLPIPLGICGILFMAYGSLLMLREAQLATANINTEMDFTWRLAREVAPESFAAHLSIKGWHDGEQTKNEVERFRTKIQNALARRRTEKES